MSHPAPTSSPRSTTWLTFAAGSAIGALLMLVGWMLFAPPSDADLPEPTPSTPDAASSSHEGVKGQDAEPDEITQPADTSRAPQAPLTVGGTTPASAVPTTPLAPQPSTSEGETSDAKTRDSARGLRSLSVIDSALTHQIKGRMPIDRLDAFSMDVGQVWAWTRVRNPGVASHITMVWRYQNQVRARVKLKVGTSPGWRTWSSKRIQAHEVGLWTVEVRDAEDRLLETLRFEVFEEGC